MITILHGCKKLATDGTFICAVRFFGLHILGKEIFMSDIQSAVNSFKLSFFKNNKTQNNNKVTEKLFAKYKLKSEDEQQKDL